MQAFSLENHAADNLNGSVANSLHVKTGYQLARNRLESINKKHIIKVNTLYSLFNRNTNITTNPFATSLNQK